LVAQLRERSVLAISEVAQTGRRHLYRHTIYQGREGC
jgi:hypothetical protein